MTRILQISDLHVMPDGVLFQGRVDTAAALNDMLAGITRLLPAIGPVERLVISGDLTETGCDAAYVRLNAVMAECPVPWLAIPGNHDRRDAMRGFAARAGWMPDHGPINWCEDLGTAALIGLDTLVEGHAHGALSDETLDWLRTTLRELRHHTVLVFMHHPPIKTGIAGMDAIGLERPERLEAVLREHDGPLQIACGHVHRMMVGHFAGRQVVISPGTSHAVGLDLRARGGLDFIPGHVGAILHVLEPEPQTLLISAEDFLNPIQFG
ncbi:MAG: phosphodiesterase [Roseovarius sp.]|jgi:3',5'-cyclic AMP phosphodiesterase CpdA|uniref:phosphodiesterase n=1 Tax=Roseovarius sp. TaxID=1486281 RepID=UPI0032EC8CD7